MKAQKHINAKLDGLAWVQGEKSFTSFDGSDEQVEKALGIAISNWSEWDGFKIMRVLFSALEDSNFHEWAGRVQTMIAEEGGTNG